MYRSAIALENLDCNAQLYKKAKKKEIVIKFFYTHALAYVELFSLILLPKNFIIILPMVC